MTAVAAGLAIPTSVLRLGLAASGAAAWLTTGVWAVVDSPIAAVAVAVIAAASTATVVVRPQTWVPAAFLVLVILARIGLSSAPSDLTGIGLGIAFVMAVVATHCLAGVCAVLSGPGTVEVRALAPGLGRFAMVTGAVSVVMVSVVMVSASVIGRLSPSPGVAVGIAALAAVASIATVAALSANERRSNRDPRTGR